MRKLIYLSLVINVVVLVPVCTGLMLNAAWAVEAYGAAAPARGILLSVYIAICAVSILLIFRPVAALVAPLLLIQVVYKVTTPVTVGTLDHPVVISNLTIALVHLLTLIEIAINYRKYLRSQARSVESPVQ